MTSLPARILVLAGTNGAGKSSVMGEFLTQHGGSFFNPDDWARRILNEGNAQSLTEANALAWKMGRDALEKAIAKRTNFNFETTLGGSTITGMLLDATHRGIDVIVWYVGLDSAERHIRRVRARVVKGGHDIPEQKIRERYDQSRAHLIELLPHVEELKVFDNSGESDPHAGGRPWLSLLLHVKRGRIMGPGIEELGATPEWAKAIVAVAMREHLGHK